ncbi:hypothetical protein EI94DRAFT_1204762 [Lactarius quietus]|nr:hypothetical protein EI94DRAFT_1204762 [Lactarius quietus]
MRPIAVSTSRNLFLRLDADIPQSHVQMTNGSRDISDSIFNWSDRKHSMTEEVQIPMMLFDAKLFPDKCSYTSSSSGAMSLHTMPEEANRASQPLSEGEQLVASATKPPSQSCEPEDGGTTAKKLYQCSSESCSARFSQRQGLMRHSKDKHSPKKRCDFCMEFTWSEGRRYVYQRHVQRKHPGVESPVSTTPSVRRRDFKPKGQHFRQNSTS